PGLSIVERAGDLASAARAIRSGEAIGAVYVPADFERDLKAERRPQVVAFYNQQFLTAAGIASSGLSDSLTAAVSRAVTPAAPKPARIGSLVAETIVLVNPERTTRSSFCARCCRWSSTWSSRSPPATRSAPSFTGAACEPGSPARAATRSSRSPASLRP